MKTKVLYALLIISFCWATGVSYLYWKLKNNPRVVAITMEAGKESLQNVQLGEMEKLTFLRQYLDRYFNYDSNNFWQSQTSLAFLMAPKLGEERVREVSRLREKIQQKNLSQLGQLLTLKASADGVYEARMRLQIHTTSGTGTEVQKNELFVNLRLKLQNTERTLENPWGLLVQDMIFANSSPQPPLFKSQVFIKSDSPTLITFPCSIENIENPAEKDLKIKITTLNVSEIQLTAHQNLSLPLSLVALCKDSEYKFELVQGQDRDLFISFPKESGNLRKQEAASPKARKKDVYEKTIENVLGIQLDK